MRFLKTLSWKDEKLYKKIKNYEEVRKAVVFLSVVLFSFLFILPFFSKNTDREQFSNGFLPSQNRSKNDNTDSLKFMFSNALKINSAPNQNNQGEMKSSQNRDKRKSKETKEIVENNVTRGFGYFTLKTNPPWVKVSIDDKKIGETPTIGIRRYKRGLYKLNLEKKNYIEYQDFIKITPGDTLTIRIEMKKIKDSILLGAKS